MNSQLRELLEQNPDKHTELLGIIKQFRDEELEHHHTGLNHDAENVNILIYHKEIRYIIKVNILRHTCTSHSLR